MNIITPPKPWPEKANLVVYGADQPEYLPLPALRRNDSHGIVTSCWHLNFRERIQLLFRGNIYLSLWTFNKPIQPQRIALKLDG